jgi:hypothetical protein
LTTGSAKFDAARANMVKFPLAAGANRAFVVAAYRHIRYQLATAYGCAISIRIQ